jgi:hypothetical protein
MIASIVAPSATPLDAISTRTMSIVKNIGFENAIYTQLQFNDVNRGWCYYIYILVNL